MRHPRSRTTAPLVTAAAIMAGAPMPQGYIESMVACIDACGER